MSIGCPANAGAARNSSRCAQPASSLHSRRCRKEAVETTRHSQAAWIRKPTAGGSSVACSNGAMDVEQGNAFHHVAAELHRRPILKVLELEGHIFGYEWIFVLHPIAKRAQDEATQVEDVFVSCAFFQLCAREACFPHQFTMRPRSRPAFRANWSRLMLSDRLPSSAPPISRYSKCNERVLENQGGRTGVFREVDHAIADRTPARPPHPIRAFISSKNPSARCRV